MAQAGYLVTHIDYQWLTADIVQLNLLSSDLFKTIQAGQYLILNWGTDQITTSITNSPIDPEQPFQCLLRQSPITQTLIEEINNLNSFRIQGPFGEGLPPKQGNILCLAGGTGLAPFLSWIDYWQTTSPGDALNISLVWGVNQESDWIIHPEHCPKQVTIKSLIRPNTPLSWLNEHPIDNYNHFYLCGPYLMIQEIYQKLISLGVSHDAIYSDMPIKS